VPSPIIRCSGRGRTRLGMYGPTALPPLVRSCRRGHQLTHRLNALCLPLQSRLQRDFITREQLGLIFAAREDMKRAFDGIAAVFDTGRINHAQEVRGDKLMIGAPHGICSSCLSLWASTRAPLLHLGSMLDQHHKASHVRD
jgi:hypothetical protein